MRTPYAAIALFVCSAAAQQQAPGLRGIVTDPSGAPIPGASVQLRGARDRSTRTDGSGRYTLGPLPPGRYELRIGVKGFKEARVKDLAIGTREVFDVQLEIQGGKEFVTVEGQPRSLSAEPGSNGGAVTLGRRQLAALSDDPDELAMQLQALAGPAPGPNGGQIFIDGFSGGSLPPKSAIREVRVNANPFSPEYDSPGFARVEIFTKPGSEALRGQLFSQWNDAIFNSRNPLLLQTSRSPYRVQFSGGNVTGPLRKNRAAFTVGMERRRIEESSLILATTLDENLRPVKLNQTLPRPQTRTSLSPRLDYTLTPKHTLVARYQELRLRLDNQGVGDFNLPSRAYDERQVQRTIQLTETAAINARTVNETRFQFLRSVNRTDAYSDAPAISVQGAFNSGGSISGKSGTATNGWEFANLTIYTRGPHTFKWGGRARQSLLTDTSRFNFNGAYTFFTLDEYRKGLPAQFRLSAGTATTKVSQADAGIFVNDDWRVRSNLTLSYGLRTEAQSNLRNGLVWAPRAGVAWGLDAKQGRPAKTVLRAGAGAFYDRVPLQVGLNGMRFNGITQQSYLILNPAFFPVIPGPGELAAAGETQQLQPVFAGLATPRLYQTSIGLERQLNAVSRITLSWVRSRGLHLLNQRNVNAPLGDSYPFGDRSVRLLTESAGLSGQNQLIVNTNVGYRGVLLFGFYTLSAGQDNNEGVPANPYDLRAEWGPSSYADLRHRVAMGATFHTPANISVAPFLAANSGQPYNITTGFDPNGTGFAAERPAGVGRNGARGPGAVNLALRLSRTWTFGSAKAVATGTGDDTSQHGTLATEGGKYALTLSANTLNVLNHPNYANPVGNMSSPYFGQYRSLGGFVILAHDGTPSTYNRKIDLQLRLTF